VTQSQEEKPKTIKELAALMIANKSYIGATAALATRPAAQQTVK